MSTHVSLPRPTRRRARVVVTGLSSAVAMALVAAPAHADVGRGWGGETAPRDLDFLHALGLYLGAPLGLFVLIALAIYVPAMVRGEKLLPGHNVPEGQWIGGPRQGVAELPAPDGEDSQAGGASGRW